MLATHVPNLGTGVNSLTLGSLQAALNAIRYRLGHVQTGLLEVAMQKIAALHSCSKASICQANYCLCWCDYAGTAYCKEC